MLRRTVALGVGWRCATCAQRCEGTAGRGIRAGEGTSGTPRGGGRARQSTAPCESRKEGLPQIAGTSRVGRNGPRFAPSDIASGLASNAGMWFATLAGLILRSRGK
jgi:hypothetical protein